MAIPFLLPLLFTAGSVAANSIAENQRARALASTQQAERTRQRQFDAEQNAINTQQREQFDGFTGKQGERSESLANMFTEVLDEAPTQPVSALPQSSSNLVVSNENAARGEARGRSEDRAQRLGDLRGFGDLFGDISRQQGTDAARLGLIGSMRRGSQSILPLELQMAQQKGGGMRLLGDLLSLGAGATSGPALAGGSAAGGAVTSSLRPRSNPFY